MTTLLLIRHASNDYLKEQRFAGWIPGIHLNAQGQREADALARRLQAISLHAIYSSPLERARDTAHAVAMCQHLDVNIVPALGDTRIPEWEGKLIQDVTQTDTWKQLMTKPVGVHIGGGESIDEVQQRMVAALDQIVAKHPKQIVAVFTHADPIKAVVAYYLKMDLNEFQRIIINPASVTIFLFGEHGPVLYCLNDNGKLPTFKPEKEKADNPASERKE